MGWRETNCVTQVRTPLQDLPCDAVIPGNLNKANSGFCECTYGNKNIVFGCGDPFEFATCNDACGYNEVAPRRSARNIATAAIQTKQVHMID